jgi:hypothetical protein
VTNVLAQGAVQTINTGDPYCAFKDFNFGSFLGAVAGGAASAGFGAVIQAGMLPAAQAYAQSVGLSPVATQIATKLPAAAASMMPQLALEALGTNLPIPNAGMLGAPACKKK